MARQDPWAEFDDAPGNGEPAPQNRMVEIQQEPEDPLFQDPGSTLEMGADQWSLRGRIYGQPAESVTPSMRDRLEKAKAAGATEDQLANMAANLAAGQGFRFDSEQERAIQQAALAPGATPDSVLAAARPFLPPGATLDPESIAKVIEYHRANPKAQWSGVGYGSTDEMRTKEIEREKFGDYLDPAIEARKDQAVDPLMRGAGNTAMLGWEDEISAMLETVYGNVSDQYGYSDSIDENLKRNRALSEADRRENPGWRTAGQVAGGFAPLPFSAIPAAARAAALTEMRAALASGLTRETARAQAMGALRSAMVRRGAGEGAAYGTISGAGNADGDVADRGLGALAGGAMGGVAGGTVSGLGGQASRMFPQRRQPTVANEARDAFDAADRLNIKLVPADVGGPATRRGSGVISQTIVGGQPVINAAGRTVEQSRAARDKIAETFGTMLEPEAAGQGVREGLNASMKASGAEARTFYEGARKAAEGVRIDTPKAMAALDDNISDLTEIPGGTGGLSTLQGIRDRMVRGGMTVEGIRGMRTVLRDQFLKEGLRGSDIERRVNQVIDAAAEDVADGLTAAGKADAASLFRKGDTAWRERVRNIDKVFAPIIGKDGEKSGEQIVKTLTADLQNNNARAVKLLNSLPPKEQGDLRASIIGGLGGEGEVFSLAKFLTSWDKIGDTAKRAYFGAEGKAALDDLAKVAKARGASEKYLNRSNTGSIVSTVATGGSLAAGIPAAVATVGGQYAVGRLLASPRFARWLARAPRTQLSAPAYIDRLNRIARAEPTIANDIFQLRQRLNEFVTGSMPARLAADEGLDAAPRVQVQQNQEDQYPGEELPQ